MNGRFLRLLGASAFLLVASTGAVPAEGLRLSTLTVKVISVERETMDRHTYRHVSFPTGEVSTGWSERTTFVARAQVNAVLNGDDDLHPGAIIEIHYVTVGSSVPAEEISGSLTSGDVTTLTVFKNQANYYWRRAP